MKRTKRHPSKPKRKDFGFARYFNGRWSVPELHVRLGGMNVSSRARAYKVIWPASNGTYIRARDGKIGKGVKNG